jgi:hypothetical protein
VIVLSPRAIEIIERQLALRARLVGEGNISHDRLFFKADGEPIRNLQYPYARWRKTLERLPMIRYRKPYAARHSSVSWNLMIGGSALWVARQHGHSIATMLRSYAAWAEGAVESDLGAIRRAIGLEKRRSRSASSTQRLDEGSSLDSALAGERSEPSARIERRRTGGERGIRTLEGLLTLTPLAGVRLRPLGHLSAGLNPLSCQAVTDDGSAGPGQGRP